MSRTLSLTILATLLARTAAADTPPAAPDEKSPGTALGLSIGVTAIGVGLTVLGAETNDDNDAVAGLVLTGLGPSAGHWYAGQAFTWGLGARLLGVGVFALGASQFQLDLDFCVQECPPEPPQHDNTGAALLMLSGALLFGGGAAYDIATAPGAADDYNARHASVSIAPTVLRDAHGDTAPGLAFVGSF